MKAGLLIEAQQLVAWGGIPDLDCLTLFRAPRAVGLGASGCAHPAVFVNPEPG
jgi:hypothetical protein